MSDNKKLQKLLQQTQRLADKLNESLSSACENGSEEFPYDSSPMFIKNTEMRSYQLKGLNWLIALHKNNINGILADEMGLGKTLQTISLLAYLQTKTNEPLNHLILVPHSTVPNWMHEFKQWCPQLNAVNCTGVRKDRQKSLRALLQNPEKWQICVISYQLYLQDIHILKHCQWHYVIVDEGQRVKNFKAKLTEFLMLLQSKHRLLLTGTPIQNNLHELGTLLHFLHPEVFDCPQDLVDWFEPKPGTAGKQPFKIIRTIIQPFLLRRLKMEVEQNLLPKKEFKILVGMSELQREWYTNFIMKNLKIITNGTEITRLYNVLMRLRQCANHPYMLPGVEAGPPYVEGPHLIINSGKMIVLDKLLLKLQYQGSRVLIFSQFTSMLSILEDYLVYREYSYHRLDGNTPQDTRQQQIEEFNSPNSPTFIFLLSTRAGGLGINLQTADVVIFYDSDWNPQMDLQAMDRAHRIGQKKQVRVFRLITEQSVEERILQFAERKLRLDKMIIQSEDLVANDEGCLNKQEMLNILRFSANQVFSSVTMNQLSDEDIDNILARGEAGTSTILDIVKVPVKNIMKPKLADIEDFHFVSTRLLDLLAKPKLTAIEQIESNALVEQSFTHWTRSDFETFVEAIIKYGRDNDQLLNAVPGKSLIDVSTYKSVFWMRCNELKGIDEIMHRIKAAENVLNEKDYIKNVIKSKVSHYRAPLRQLRFQYELDENNNGEDGYSQAEDRFLICTLNRLGYDKENVYEDLRLAVCAPSAPLPANSLLKNRSTKEMQSRCSKLIDLIVQEQEKKQEKHFVSKRPRLQ